METETGTTINTSVLCTINKRWCSTFLWSLSSIRADFLLLNRGCFSNFKRRRRWSDWPRQFTKSSLNPILKHTISIFQNPSYIQTNIKTWCSTTRPGSGWPIDLPSKKPFNPKLAWADEEFPSPSRNGWARPPGPKTRLRHPLNPGWWGRYLTAKSSTILQKRVWWKLPLIQD